MVPDDGGFVLTWIGYAHTPYQIQARRVERDGKLGVPIVLHDDRLHVDPISAGAADGTLRALFLDRTLWPLRVRIKEAKVGRSRIPP